VNNAHELLHKQMEEEKFIPKWKARSEK